MAAGKKVEKAPLRRYSGQTGAERQQARHERFMDAALEVFGTVGYASSSVDDICAEAGLAKRYFYESFKDREDLLYALYERLTDEVIAKTFRAVEAAEPTLEARARAGSEAFFRHLTGDVRRARVQSFEVIGVSRRLEQRRRDAMHVYANFLAQVAVSMFPKDGTPALDPALAAMSVTGAFNEVLLEWVLGYSDASVDELIDHCARLMVGITRLAAGVPFSDDGPGPRPPAVSAAAVKRRQAARSPRSGRGNGRSPRDSSTRPSRT